ncbi:MAG: phosphate ABC transporter substrate-binding protein PstS [Rubrobacteraceae bacterium]
MSKSVRLWMMVVSLSALSFVIAACGGGNNDSGNTGGGGAPAVDSLSGAGASFPDPVYQQMFQAYNGDTGVQVNYDPIGSGGGREEFINNTVDFAGSDAPMDQQEQDAAGGNPVHVPTVGGAVVLAYNIPELGGDTELKLTGDVISEIFLGNITTWDDPAIADLNPDVQLPGSEITVVHRSDGSGTTEIFTTYLTDISQAWSNGPGASDEIDWPTGVGGEGNDGVTAQITNTENSIGYIGLEYAEGQGEGLPYASVANTADGSFVKPSTDTASNAINAVVDQLPDTLDVVLTEYTPDAQGENIYPITSITWLLVRTEMEDKAVCTGVANLANYMITDGQQFAPEQNYVPLPDSLAEKSQGQIEKMQSGGEKCYTK